MQGAEAPRMDPSVVHPVCPPRHEEFEWALARE